MSISVLGEREEGAGRRGAGRRDWEHYPEREELLGLEDALGDNHWQPDLVNKSAENNPFDFNME